MNFLITGCFAPGTSGTLMGIAKSNLPFQPKLYGIDSNPVTSNLKEFERIDKLDSTHAEEYIENLNKLIRKNSIDLIIPQTTRESLLLSKYSSELDRRSIILSQNKYKCIELANDKYSLQKLSISNSITTGKCIPYEEYQTGLDYIESSNNLGKDIYFKARNLSGGRGVCEVKYKFDLVQDISNKVSSIHSISYAQLIDLWESRNKDLEDYFLDEAHIGQEYTVDVFLGSRGQIAIPRKRISIRTGISQVNLIEEKHNLAEASLQLAKLIGIRGLFGFQFIEKHDGSLAILECNPRIQGTNIASILSGTNLIEMSIKEELNLEYSITKPNWGSRFRRTWGGEIF